MKKIISAIILIAMLMTTALTVIPVSAAANEVTDAATFNAALKAAEGDTTITIPTGTTVTLTSFTWPSADATVTITGGGTLDVSGIQAITMGCGLVFDGVTVYFLNDHPTDPENGAAYLYANGNPLTIKSNVTVAYKDVDGNVVAPTASNCNIDLGVYGGRSGGTINGDTYVNIQSGNFNRIYGGSRGGTVNGNTNVIIGTEGYVNSNTLVGWSDTTHGSSYQFFGGSNTGTINGNTNITVGQYGYADYVVGGNNSGGKISGTANMYFSGYAYGLYGGSRGGNTMNDVNLVMLGGGVCDIMGGSNGYSLGSSSEPSNVYVKIFGGEIRRRVYAGSYQDGNNGALVYGTTTLIIGGSPDINFKDTNDDRGVFAHTRYSSNSTDEKPVIIFLGGKTYTVGRASGDSLGSLFVGSGHNPSTKHQMTYATSGTSITETCSCGCGHSDSITLSLTNDEFLYRGEPIECASYAYGSGWMSGPIDSFGYENNNAVGTGTAYMSLNMVSDYRVTASFEIYDPTGLEPGTPGTDYDQSGSIDVSYTVEETYVFYVPDTLALGDVGVAVPLEVSVTKTVLDVQNAFKVYVKSANGFKVVDSDTSDSIKYDMTYGDSTMTSESEGATVDVHIMTIRWDDEENAEACELGIIRRGEAINGTSYSDHLTFSVEMIFDGVPPLINELAFDTDAYDVGDGSLLYVKEDVADTYDEGVAIFDAYVADLQTQGYSLYTTNTIAENHFATLHTPKQILNVMYIDYYKDIRVVTDLKSVFDLPGLEMENSYDKWAQYTPNLTLVSGPDIRWPGRMGYIYQLDDGSFFIIDGGYMKASNTNKVSESDFAVTLPENAKLPNANYGSSVPYVQEVLERYAPDPNNIVIAAWFITHTHEDHYGTFFDISVLKEYADLKSRITIEQFIYNKSSDWAAAKTDIEKQKGKTDNVQLHNAYQVAIDSWSEDQMLSKVKAHPGQVFYLRNLEMTVYTSQELLHGSEHYLLDAEGNEIYNPFTTGNSSSDKCKYINNTSVVTMVNFMGKNTLYLGDASSATNPYVVAPVYGSDIVKTQILQVAHHGYPDTAADSTYKIIANSGNLEVIFWPTNADHFYGKEFTPSDYDCPLDGSYSDTFHVAFNQQLLQTGATVYIHGLHNITISDFDTYEPEYLTHPSQKFDKDTWIGNLGE